MVYFLKGFLANDKPNFMLTINKQNNFNHYKQKSCVYVYSNTIIILKSGFDLIQCNGYS